MIQEGAELWRKVFQHETMVVRFLKFAHLFLSAQLKMENKKRELASCHWDSRSGPSPYFVFDFPPWKLTNREFHQHVEQGPQVVMATHFLEMATHMTGTLQMTNSSAGSVSCAHLILMSVNRSVSHSSSESRHRTRLSKKTSPLHKQFLHSVFRDLPRRSGTYRSDFLARVGKLARQAKIQHIAASAGTC